MTINDLIERLQLLKTQASGDAGIAVFGEDGEGPELSIDSVEVEGRARPYVAINCEKA